MAEIRQTDVSDFCKIAPIFGHPSCCSQQNILRMILFSAHDLSMTNKKALAAYQLQGRQSGNRTRELRYGEQRQTTPQSDIPSSIRTIPSVPESHRFSPPSGGVADYTAGRDFHPALKRYVSGANIVIFS